ncbi:MAG: 16S rRNA (guanine(527)-N(7))-methyltransferase RsmG [Bauldia litoralis]
MTDVDARGFGAAQFGDRFAVSRETLQALELYAERLLAWQQRINLISQTTAPDAWWRHFADSAQLVDVLPEITAAPRDRSPILADIGSGAGFPGLVIGLMRPMFHVKLIESNAKKAAFLQEIVARTGAGNVEILRERAEKLKGWTADIITARACASLGGLLDMTDTIRRPDTVCLFLKGETAQRELTEAREEWKITVDSTPSVTNPDSVILKISEVYRVR